MILISPYVISALSSYGIMFKRQFFSMSQFLNIKLLIYLLQDFEAEQEISKRQKKTENILNVPDKTKRGREEDSPTTDPQNKNSIQPLAKKICVVDMLAASYTSSQLYKERLEKGLQNKIEGELDRLKIYID